MVRMDVSTELSGGAVKLARRQRLLIDGTMHQVRRRIDETRFNVEAIETGLCSTHTYEWLDEAWTEGRITILPMEWEGLDRATQEAITSEMDAFSNAQRRTAVYRQPYAQALLDHQEGKSPRGAKLFDQLRKIADERNAPRAPADYEKPPSRSQLYSFTARWAKAGQDVRALMPHYDLRGNRNARMEPELGEIIDELIERIWLTPVARSKAALFAACKTYVKELNTAAGEPGADLDRPITLPTASMVRKRLAKLQRYDLDYYRKDPLKAQRDNMPVMLGPVSTRVNQRWELDSTPIDVHVVDVKTRARLGRPTLTAVIDTATRVIVGWALSFEGESTLQIMMALRHAIRPKAAVKGVRNVNPGRGKPEGVWFDNAMAHDSHSLRDAALRLNFSPFLLPPRQPRLRGKIERWFKSLNLGLIHNLRGTTKSNPKDKGDYDAENDAVLTLDELNWLIGYWICDVYHPRMHRTTRQSPLDLWAELAAQHAPVLPAHVKDLDVLLSRVDARYVSNKGVEWNGLLYGSTALALLANQPAFDRHDVTIRIDEADLGSIRVLDPFRKEYLVVPCTNQPYAKGKTLFQHLASIKRAKEKAEKNKAITEHDFELAWGELILAGEDLLTNKGRKKTLNRLARLFALGVDKRQAAIAQRKPDMAIDGAFDDEEYVEHSPVVQEVEALRPPEPAPESPAEVGRRIAERAARATRKAPSKPKAKALPAPPAPAPALPPPAPIPPAATIAPQPAYASMEVDYD